MKDRARILIAFFAGLLFVLFQVSFPSVQISQDQNVIFLGLIGSYILGEGLEGNRFKDNILLALRSHKLQALVAGLVIVLLKLFFPHLPITETQLTELISVLAVLIIGAGVQGAVQNDKFQG